MPRAWRPVLAGFGLVPALAVAAAGAVSAVAFVFAPHAAWADEPAPPFGAVIYRAGKVASFESLGVVVIACRHRDPVPRSFAVEFFDRSGKRVSVFGPHRVDGVPAGKKIVFVSEATYFRNRDVINVRVGHFGPGSARVISDARIVRCLGKMRFDPGALHPTYWRGMGLVREGMPMPESEPW